MIFVAMEVIFHFLIGVVAFCIVSKDNTNECLLQDLYLRL